MGREVYEYVEQMDYNRYFESMPGSRGGKVEKQYNDFSLKAAKTAQVGHVGKGLDLPFLLFLAVPVTAVQPGAQVLQSLCVVHSA